MKIDNNFRTRFAPSPTGVLHVGGARTALFCYLFAKNQEGSFIIRTEDTDNKRNQNEFIIKHIKQLNWLNIIEDESILKRGYYSPYQQSKRLEIYQKYIDILLKNNYAYFCFCSENYINNEKLIFKKNNPTKNYQYSKKCRNLSEEIIINNLNLKIPYVIRFKNIKKKKYIFNDLIRGKIIFNYSDIDDIVLIKTNKIPAYNFAVVVDDYLMKISHVLRGEEHISNTGKQLALYDAFNWSPPLFAHLNLIVKFDKKKLSKRDNIPLQYVEEYQKQGYLPEAIINFITLLGWTPIKKKEFYTMTELIELFDISKLNKAPSIFDINKLKWFNHKYIQNMNETKYLLICNEWIDTNKIIKNNNISNEQIFFFVKDKINCFSELKNEINEIFFIGKEKLFEQEFQYSAIKEKIVDWFKKNDLNSLNSANELILFIKKSLNIKGKELFLPIRLLISSKTKGCELNFLLYALGKNEILKRINYVKQI